MDKDLELEKVEQQQLQFECIRRLYRDAKIPEKQLHIFQEIFKNFVNAVVDEREIENEITENDFVMFQNFREQEKYFKDFEIEDEPDDLDEEGLELLRYIIQDEIRKFFASRN